MFIAEPGALFSSYLVLWTKTLFSACGFLLCSCRTGCKEGWCFRCCLKHLSCAEHHMESVCHVLSSLWHEEGEEGLLGAPYPSSMHRVLQS